MYDTIFFRNGRFSDLVLPADAVIVAVRRENRIDRRSPSNNKYTRIEIVFFSPIKTAVAVPRVNRTFSISPSSLSSCPRKRYYSRYYFVCSPRPAPKHPYKHGRVDSVLSSRTWLPRGIRATWPGNQTPGPWRRVSRYCVPSYWLTRPRTEMRFHNQSRISQWGGGRRREQKGRSPSGGKILDLHNAISRLLFSRRVTRTVNFEHKIYIDIFSDYANNVFVNRGNQTRRLIGFE